MKKNPKKDRREEEEKIEESFEIVSETDADLEMSEDIQHEHLKSVAEALIFSATEPLTEAQFMLAAGRRAKGKLAGIVEELNSDYATTGRSFEILRVAGGYQYFTRSDFAGPLRKYFTERSRTRLSRAALETLAVVAFRGPVTRIEIDEIRGVDSGGVLRTLLDRRLINVKGRAEVVGRPLLYRITDEFLKHFGLSDISELPRHSELSKEWGELMELERNPGIAGELPDPADTESESSEDFANHPELSKSTNGHHHLKPTNLDDSDDDNET